MNEVQSSLQNPNAQPKASSIITSPNGTEYTALVHGNTVVLKPTADPHQTIVITGGTVQFDIGGFLGSIADKLGSAVGGLMNVLTCRPETVTTVSMGNDGKVTSVVTKTTCAAN